MATSFEQSTERLPVARCLSLEAFVRAVTSADGLELARLDLFDEVRVQTRNSHYRIFAVRPWRAEVVVQGGKFFPDPTPAFLSGSSLGGSALKLGWIARGFCMEIHDGARQIVTSPVQSIEIRTQKTGVPS